MAEQATDPIADAVKPVADEIMTSDPFAGISAEALAALDEEPVAAEAAEPTEPAGEAAPETDKEPEGTPVSTGSVEGATPPPVAAASEPEPAAPVTPVIAAAPTSPEPTKAPEPSPDPLEAEAKAWQDRYAKFTGDRDALRQKIAKGEYDALGEDGRELARIQLEESVLNEQQRAIINKYNAIQQQERAAEQQAAAQKQAVADQWAAWGKQHADLGGAEWGQKILNDEYQKAIGEGATPEAAAFAANRELKARVTLVRAQKAAAAKKEPAPAAPAKAASNNPQTKKAPTQVTPPTGGVRIVRQDPADELEEFASKFGKASTQFLQ